MEKVSTLPRAETLRGGGGWRGFIEETRCLGFRGRSEWPIIPEESKEEGRQD